ncbi:hypothetical protein [Leptospira yanagawae]|uniref:hypothetical protein n=1 Tax=Leptospira yanagawae TaxID=293069 RepID=UPI0012EBA533|nr:hypothetical protein [Leptospira yanagawae]
MLEFPCFANLPDSIWNLLFRIFIRSRQPLYIVANVTTESKPNVNNADPTTVAYKSLILVRNVNKGKVYRFDAKCTDRFHNVFFSQNGFACATKYQIQ